ncbi:MAG: hypothetical protein ACC628_23780 [Pirellulaceae bacterium]
MTDVATLDNGLIVRVGQGRFAPGKSYYQFLNRLAAFTRMRQHEVRKEQVNITSVNYKLNELPARGDLPC